MHEVGIMQGRLSLPPAARVQAFPWGSWDKEFTVAAHCGFAAIEWLFEAERFDQNPIWTDAGRDAIRRASEKSGVKVKSLCADYFMLHPFHGVSSAARAHSVGILCNLLHAAAAMGIQILLVPVLEAAELRDASDESTLFEALRDPLDVAARAGIRIGLETELPATRYRDLAERASHPSLGVYYDTGNAAAKGYDTAWDISQLDHLLFGIHLKDRPVGGASVPLGEGTADFDRFFPALCATGYEGPLIIQSTSGPDYIGIAKRHLARVNDGLRSANL